MFTSINTASATISPTATLEDREKYLQTPVDLQTASQGLFQIFNKIIRLFIKTGLGTFLYVTNDITTDRVANCTQGVGFPTWCAFVEFIDCFTNIF